MEIAIGVHIRILQVSTHASQENLGFVVGPSQDAGEERQRVGFHGHKEGTQIIPADLLLDGVPRPTARRDLCEIYNQYMQAEPN